MCYDLYCVLCGVVNWNILDNINLKKLNEKLGDDRISEEKFNRLKERLIYTDDITIMTKNNHNFHKCNNIDCGFSYTCDDDKKYNDPDNYFTYWVQTTQTEKISQKKADESHFILSKLIHTDCWNYIKNKYDKELKYSDLKINEYDAYVSKIKPQIFNEEIDNRIKLSPPLDIDYGEIKYYWSNDYGFLIDNIIKDKKEYLLYSPLEQKNKLARYTNKKKKKTSRKTSKKSGRQRGGNENKIDDIKKNLERIDYIYKQIINL